MRKIISLFKRDYEGTRLVYNEVVEGAEWVIAGEGMATEKTDGTACLIKDGRLYKRYDAKKGKKPPENFLPAESSPNEHTGHWPGWVPVGDGPEDKWHRDAFKQDALWIDGTYELLGPKVQGNPYGMTGHELVRHGSIALTDMFGKSIVPTDFEGLKQYLIEYPYQEGIVWWRDLADIDCDKVKLKRKDYGLEWPIK